MITMGHKLYVGGLTDVFEWTNLTGVWASMGLNTIDKPVWSIGGTSDTDIWAGCGTASGYPIWYHWDGSTWTQYTNTSVHNVVGGGSVKGWTIHDIWAVSSDLVFAIAHWYDGGSNRNGLFKWNGAAWVVVAETSMNFGNPCSVWGTNDIYLSATDPVPYGDKDIGHWTTALLREAAFVGVSGYVSSIRGYDSSEMPEIYITPYGYGAGSAPFKKGAWGSWAQFDPTLVCTPAVIGGSSIQLTPSAIWAMVQSGPLGVFIRRWERSTLAGTSDPTGASGYSFYNFAVIDEGNYIVSTAGANPGRMKVGGVWSDITPTNVYGAWGYTIIEDTPYNKDISGALGDGAGVGGSGNVLRATIEAVGEEM